MGWACELIERFAPMVPYWLSRYVSGGLAGTAVMVSVALFSTRGLVVGGVSGFWGISTDFSVSHPMAMRTVNAMNIALILIAMFVSLGSNSMSILGSRTAASAATRLCTVSFV